MSDVVYTLGPTLLGFTAALAIAVYLWRRLRIASISLLVWFVVAAVIGRLGNLNGLCIVSRCPEP